MPHRQPDEEDDVFGRVRRRENAGLMVAVAGLALTFMVQFGGSIWWGATLSADLRHVTETLARMDMERYTKADAARDLLRLDQRDQALSEQISELRARQASIENRDARPR